jgi:uncharacterized protein YggE
MKNFAIAVFLILTTPLALAQTPPPMADSVTVSGTGRASVTPDRFTFSVGVQTVAATVEDAVAENNRRVAAVIAALKKAGAQDKDIQTSQFSIYPQQDYQQGKLPRIVGYQVSNNITVRSSKVGDAGRLLGIAVGAGVNHSSGINFEVADPARGRDQGLRAAFDDARAKAALLAAAAGRTLGPAIVISEGTQHTPPPMPMGRVATMEARLESSDVPVESGSQQVTYNVTVTFAMR